MVCKWLIFLSNFFRIRSKCLYLMNMNTREIHRLENHHVSCNLHVMSNKNKWYITEKRALRLLTKGQADGCRWCWPEKNNG